MVVDKRAGLLSMGSESEKERTAHRILNEHLKALSGVARRRQAFIVHRLDRETSGLMMFARSRAIQAALQQNWKTVTKKYLAVVEGIPPTAEGTLRDNLVESKSMRMHRVERGGELAITHYRVVQKGRDNSLIELTLETGPQEPDSRADGGFRSSYCRRWQIWCDYRSCAAARATFVRAEVPASGVGRVDGISQRDARPADGADPGRTDGS